MWGYTSTGDAVRLRSGNQKLDRGNVAWELFDERHEGTLAYESKLNRMKIKTDIPMVEKCLDRLVQLYEEDGH